MGGTERVYEYDLDGNVIGNGVYSPALGTTVENSSYTYNAAAQMIAAEKTVSGQVAANKSFGYDGRGMRVTAASGGGQTHYVYAKSGTFIGEYAGAPAEGKENVYLGTQLVATVSINVAPVASAGPDKQILTYQQASLDGSAYC